MQADSIDSGWDSHTQYIAQNSKLQAAQLDVSRNDDDDAASSSSSSSSLPYSSDSATSSHVSDSDFSSEQVVRELEQTQKTQNILCWGAKCRYRIYLFGKKRGRKQTLKGKARKPSLFPSHPISGERLKTCQACSPKKIDAFTLCSDCKTYKLTTTFPIMPGVVKTFCCATCRRFRDKLKRKCPDTPSLLNKSKCGICARTFHKGPRKNVVRCLDHNHETNTNRGYLCDHCNKNCV